MLHYSIFKEDAHTEWVTFVHGAGGSSAIWYKQIREFQKKFNILLVDLRGHGQSKQKIYQQINRYTFSSISDDILEVLDHLKIKSSHFVGISLGTIIIREISERFPKRVDSLIMGGAVMKLNIRGQVLMRFGFLVKSILPYLVLYRLFARIVMPRRTHRESRNLFIGEAKKLYQKEFKRWFTLISQINPLLRLFRIKEAASATFYIMGNEDHMFLPSISKLVRNHVKSTLYIVPNCGHVVNIEQAEIFNQAVLSFLETNTKKSPFN